MALSKRKLGKTRKPFRLGSGHSLQVNNGRLIYNLYMAVNREWHLVNRMPKNPTEEQRAKWHIAHIENCNCYPMSESIKTLIAKYGGETKSS